MYDVTRNVIVRNLEITVFHHVSSHYTLEGEDFQ